MLVVGTGCHKCSNAKQTSGLENFEFIYDEFKIFFIPRPFWIWNTVIAIGNRVLKFVLFMKITALQTRGLYNLLYSLYLVTIS